MDLEMTGLEADRHVIVEIATLVTDDDLDVVAEGPDLVVGATEAQLAAMDDFVRDMHTSSGLLEEIRASELTLAEAGRSTVEFIRSHVPKARTVPLAGNSIGTDRRFLAAHLPEIEEYLHYRSVDVSTVKELAGRWYPEARPPLPRRPGGTGPWTTSRSPWRSWRTTGSTIFRDPPPEAGRRGGPVPPEREEAPMPDEKPSRTEPEATTPPRTPYPAGPRSTAHADRPGRALRDGGGRHPGHPHRGRGRPAPADLRAVFELSALHGDKDFLVYEDERVTFAEHHRIVAALGHQLVERFGVRPGDRVAIAMRNLPDWVMAFWAVITIGAVAVPLNAWWTGEELAYGLSDSGSRVAFVDEEREHRISHHLAEVPGLEALIVSCEEHDPDTGGRRPAVHGQLDRDGRRTAARHPLHRGGRHPGGRHRPCPRSPSIPTTTPPSSTPRAPPAGRRVRSAPTATAARTS